MKTKNKLMVLGSNLLIAMMTFALGACGGGGGGNSSTGGGGAVEKIFDISTLKEDLIVDENNKVLFDEEVVLKVWCIVGDPDRVVFRDLVSAFNDEFMGQIRLDVVYQGHFDFYNALETTYTTDFEESFPDVCFMHNEKTVEYAYKEYLYPLDQLFEKTTVDMDLTNVYTNIDRVTQYRDHRFALPVDAHGFVTQFRQDIIKKNGLGFDNNSRFIPESKAEYEQLLSSLRTKADSSAGLMIRNINKGQDHSWKKADPAKFFPSFTQSADPDGLSALYANGGTMTNAAQDKVTFQEGDGFSSYLTDMVDRWNTKQMGEAGTNTETFGLGTSVMFSEGPWWVSQTYTANWNNSEMTTAGKGVTEEEAKDPIYSKPYIASNPKGWWTTDANKDGENADKWYGNGHAISLTRHITSMQKAAAALTFAKWYTQGMDTVTGDYNLATWANSGHLPAWKNVYDSDQYQALKTKSMTLRALGDPADIMAMEGLEYQTTIFKGVSDAYNNVLNQLKSSTGCSKEKALQILRDSATSTQAALDILQLV